LVFALGELVTQQEGYMSNLPNNRQLYPILIFLSFLALGGPSVQADTITFTGTFNQDDNVQLFDITQSTTNDLTIYTSSFAAGGFTPVLSLFDAEGNFITSDDGSQNSGCNALLSPDPNYYDACWDAFIVFPGAPGSSYILALTEDDNTFQGSVLADGFSEDGNGNFTGVNSGYGGSFVLSDGTQRTADWTLNIVSADPLLSGQELSAQQETSGVPEPGAGILLLNGLGFLAFARRLRGSRPGGSPSGR
jgi:hypothetical protein